MQYGNSIQPSCLLSWAHYNIDILTYLLVLGADVKVLDSMHAVHRYTLKTRCSIIVIIFYFHHNKKTIGTVQ